MPIAEVISSAITRAFNELYGYTLAQVDVEHPQNPLWGDYSTNVAMVAAKNVNKLPVVLAKEVADYLRSEQLAGYFATITTAGPGFINFTLSSEYLLGQAAQVLKLMGGFGSSEVGRGKTIALEHSNVNPNKAAHVGHLRNALIGQFVERVYEFIGYDVTVQYYSNDLGVQVSTSLLGMAKLGSDFDSTQYAKFDHYAWDVYAKISQQLDADVELKAQLDTLIVKLDSRDPEVSQKQSELSKRILKDNLATFHALDIDYDVIVYESAIKDTLMWEKTFLILKKNPKVYLATEGNSKGCWLVSLADKSAEVATKSTEIEEDKILVRSNGIPTYTGKDIAYHMWKFGLLPVDFSYSLADLGTQQKPLYETNPLGDIKVSFNNSDIVMDVIDVRQTYAISAVRKTLAYLGYSAQARNLIHINYGHVYLSNNTSTQLGYAVDTTQSAHMAMSGRKGIGVKIDDFVVLVDKALQDSFGAFPNSAAVRNAVIKFDMLRYDTFQDIVFDLALALTVKGFTGPYVQYTHARANSLLEKAGYLVDDTKLEYMLNQYTKLALSTSEQEVLKVIYKFPEVVMQSANQYAPNLVCVYLYELCQKFNAFYNDSPILKTAQGDIRDFRLFLTAATKQVIKNGLYLLGIQAVDSM
jgi:arginyl-tRNA synthetase